MGTEYGSYGDFMTEEEGEKFMSLIFEMEEWVGDDNFDQPIEEYNNRLNSLTQFGDVYVSRHDQWESRPKALNLTKKILTQIEMFLAEGHNTPDYEHIGEEPLTELANYCRDCNVWLEERQQFHDKTKKTDNPPFLSSEISSKL